MKQLLEELKRIDPVTYHEIVNFGYIGGEANYAKWIAVYDNSPPECDYIQGCIQRAIFDLGYMFSVSRIWPRGALSTFQWKARIFIDPDNIIEIRAESPAKAILLAYIATKKAWP